MKVGGAHAPTHGHPWAVLMKKIEGVREFMCGATIICSRWILTAAHCFAHQTYVRPGLGKIFSSKWYKCNNIEIQTRAKSILVIKFFNSEFLRSKTENCSIIVHFFFRVCLFDEKFLNFFSANK